MKHLGIKVFLAVVMILGLFSALSSLSSGDRSRSSTRRSGYSYSSGSKSSGVKEAPKTTGAPPKSTTKPRSTKSLSASKDPFDAASYSHPDDFYYDHYDDFWDCEEAEEYWENHQ